LTLLCDPSASSHPREIAMITWPAVAFSLNGAERRICGPGVDSCVNSVCHSGVFQARNPSETFGLYIGRSAPKRVDGDAVRTEPPVATSVLSGFELGCPSLLSLSVSIASATASAARR
jgi:hypothetical protein